MSERSRRLFAMLGTAVLVPLVVGTLQLVRDRPRAKEAPPPVRVVGCPQVKVTSSELRHHGFLGAAAATLACDRIRVRLGGRPESALPPAALVANARHAAGSAVFEEKDAAAMQRVSANARVDAVLEGELDQGKDFQITLRLVDKIGNEIGKGNGAHVSLVGAVRMASDMLTDEAGLTPRAGDAYLPNAMPGASIDAILATHDLAVDALLGDEEEVNDACDSVSRRADLGALAKTVAMVCNPWGGRPDRPMPSTEQRLREVFFSGHARGDALWLPWEGLRDLRQRAQDASAE